MSLLSRLAANYPYVFAILLFALGVQTILSHSNLIKKLMGVNIMESAVFLIFIASGDRRAGSLPIVSLGGQGDPFVNPVPTALILTGIVVSLSVSALALALIMKLYRHYGSIDASKIIGRRDQLE